MGFYGSSRIWYLRRFDAYCAEHDRTVFDQDTVEGWVTAQLASSGRYRSWMSYIRDVGRWLQAHGHSDAYVLSDRWKAPFVPARPYLLSSAGDRAVLRGGSGSFDAQSPWRWQAVAFFTLMHSCGLRTGETRALLAEHVDLRDGHIDVVVVQGKPQPPAAADRPGRRGPGRLRPGIARAASPSRRRSSSPPPATRSPRRRSGRCSTASGTRRDCRGRRAASSHGPTTSGTTSPTPTSSGG